MSFAGNHDVIELNVSVCGSKAVMKVFQRKNQLRGVEFGSRKIYILILIKIKQVRRLNSNRQRTEATIVRPEVVIQLTTGDVFEEQIDVSIITKRAI